MQYEYWENSHKKYRPWAPVIRWYAKSYKDMFVFIAFFVFFNSESLTAMLENIQNEMGSKEIFINYT